MYLALLLALMATPEKIIIDTDPGDFTDDCVAIVMCLRSPQHLKVLGITTVSGNAWAVEGVQYAKETLGLAKASVPVHLGAQRPLRHTAEQSLKEGPIEFAGAFARKRPAQQKETAVDFLIQSLEREPLTILAIGPLTNIARLLERRPDLAAKIQRIVIMGGNVRVGGNASKAAEFNFWFDPEAAQAVLRSPIREKVLFPLDICNQAFVTKKHFDELTAVKTPVTEKYAKIAGNGYPGFLKDPKATGFFWDELAAAYLIDPGIVQGEESLPLDVETRVGPRYGAVVASKDGQVPTRVMLGLDYPKAFEHIRRLMTER